MSTPTNRKSRPAAKGVAASGAAPAVLPHQIIKVNHGLYARLKDAADAAGLGTQLCAKVLLEHVLDRLDAGVVTIVDPNIAAGDRPLPTAPTPRGRKGGKAA